MYACPKGHNSTEADFCSECGVKIMGLGVTELVPNPTNPPVITSSAPTQPCPVCTTPHEADTGNFCEICGYNFLTGNDGGAAVAVVIPSVNLPEVAAVQPANPPQNLSITPNNPPGRWQVIISIDPSLASPDSPTAPTQAPTTLDLTNPTNLIGRTSQARGIHPEIPLDVDDAVSSRHAILTLNSDGALILRDIGSSNGTMVNGKEIAIMADINIRSGDEITLGHWTRIKLINS